MFADFSQLTTAEWIIILAGVGVCFSYSVWAILDVWKRDFGNSTLKSAWFQICIFVPILGATAYLLFGRKSGRKIS